MKHRRPPNNFRWGALTLVIVLIATYLGFTKDIPFTKPFTINAVFESANSIRPGSPVRIAGVAIGKVKKVSPLQNSSAAVVNMQILDKGLPIHTDATAKIRPRIFLEGNFFVDLKPGTPSAPTFDNGDTIKVTNTATPVQLDQVLTALQDPTREDLRTILRELGTGLERGAPSFNKAYEVIAPSERDTSIVNEAFLGTQPDRDLARLIKGLGKATEGLGRNEEQIQDLVTDFATTMGAFAAERENLQSSIRELGPTLDTTNIALSKINAALPATRAFARAILPGVRESAATLKAGFPWIAETRKLLSQAELRGLAQDLSPTSRDTARFVDASLKLFPQGDRLALCATRTILPTGDIVVDDQFKNGQPNYREFAYTLVGLSGEGQNSDGNGGYVHFQPGGGSQTIALGQVSPAPIFANVFPGTGTQPATPGAKPPYKSSVPCYKSDKPNVNGPESAKGSFGNPAATATPTPTP
ncbi:MAG: phospholipid/cholesterol/gamma-HCH transport system substrate-binding protein [Solirubrobacteraceae bacterium]|nr:phospholipid/cholesterol/gamma-HCH transport system substrate-binding protein [Solirubrobacteraceae bacterium]